MDVGIREGRVEALLVEHTIEPVFDSRSRVLVLGTMPSPISREQGFFYANPRNRFWPVMGAIFGEPVPEGTEARRAFALEHRVALWDVLASCDIDGASDASIKDPVPNDLSRVLDAADIRAVFTTGATATRLFRKHHAPIYGIKPIGLPSTSPANARMQLQQLVDAYRAILDYM